jgi:hypothetical protein
LATTEPIMIRGDRLLLALRVMQWHTELHDSAGVRRRPHNPHGFSNAAHFIGRVHTPEVGIRTIECGCWDALNAIAILVEINIDRWWNSEINIASILELFATCWRKNREEDDDSKQGDRVQRLIIGIASGELTEDDFKVMV